MKKASSISDLIGRTPMLEMKNLQTEISYPSTIIAKLEYFNPAGSVKDRIALSMIEEAEHSGRLNEGGTIIEPTSGNTGIGLAAVAASRGYRMLLAMPETMSIERRNILHALGAEIVLTPGAEGMKGAISKAEELHRQIEGSVIMSQFDNPANPSAHYRTTAMEIWHDTDGDVDIFVAGVGTGGTISGVGRRLKELNDKVQIVAVEPSDSPVLSGGQPGPHKIQGIGAGFIPRNYDSSVVDLIANVTIDDAFAAARAIARTEGILVGISSGAAAHVAIELAKKPENKDKTIVVVLPDTGERYLSTALFDYE